MINESWALTVSLSRWSTESGTIVASWFMELLFNSWGTHNLPFGVFLVEYIVVCWERGGIRCSWGLSVGTQTHACPKYFQVGML